MRNFHLINNKDELIDMFMLETSYTDIYYKDVILIDLQIMFTMLPMSYECFKNNIKQSNEMYDIINKYILDNLILSCVKYIDIEVISKQHIVELIKAVEKTIDYLNDNYRLSITYTKLSSKNDYDNFTMYIAKLIKILKQQINPYVRDSKQILKTDEEQITLPNVFWYNCDIDTFLYGDMFRMCLPIVNYRHKGGYKNDEYLARHR